MSKYDTQNLNPNDLLIADLPELKDALEEARQLLDRLKGRKGETDPDRYERLRQRYEEKIEELEPEVERLSEEGETRKLELENRLAHQQGRAEEAEAELEEIEALYQEGAMDEETYREERRRFQRQKKEAEKKTSRIERELDGVKFYLTETGEVSYQMEKLDGQLSEARSQVRQWSEKACLGVSEWLTGLIGSNPNLVGRGAALAIFVALSIGWFQGGLGQVEETSNLMEYTPMFRGGSGTDGYLFREWPKGKARSTMAL